MKTFITIIFIAFAVATFSQVNEIKNKQISLQYMMLYNQPIKFKTEINNHFSFQPKNTKSLKIMSTIGSTLKSIIETKGVQVTNFQDKKYLFQYFTTQ